MIIDIRMRPPIPELFPQDKGIYGGAYVELFQGKPVTPERLIEEMDEAGIGKGVIFGDDTETTWRNRKVANEQVSALVNKYPDRFIGFAGVDPHKGMAAVRELDHAVKNLGLCGLNMEPCFHRLPANDKKYYPLFAKCVELNIPVTMHISTNYIPQYLMKHGHPLLVDEVAVDFPELKFICSHAGWPWVAELMGVLWRHENVYADISGTMPKYFAKPGSGWEPLLHYGNSNCKNKILYGSKWPLLNQKIQLQQLRELPLKPEVLDLWLSGNAKRLLGL